MSDYLFFMILGLGAGAAYALLGLGIVLVFRGSGVINFAQGAIAMWVAYVFALLQQSGRYVVPIPGVPDLTIEEGGVGNTASVLIALATAFLLGLFLHVAIFRWLRESSPLAKVVATVGVMLTLQAVAVMKFGSVPVRVSEIFSTKPIHLLGFTIPRDRIYLAVITVAVGILLWALYRFTRFGLVTRAAAESEKGASLLGYSANLVAAANWALGSVVAGLGGILLAPIVGLNPVSLIYLVIPALAAALIGRFTSLGATIVAGLAIGALESGVLKLQTDFAWLPDGSIGRVIPLTAIIGALYFFGDRLPTRASLSPPRLPRATPPRSPAILAAGLFVVLLPLLFVLSSQYRAALIISMVAAVVCMSFVVLTGYLGQISLATMTLAGISGFLLSHLSSSWGVPFPFDAILAATVAAVVGAVIAIPALRIRGVTLAVVTLALAVTVDDWLFQREWFVGDVAGAAVEPPSLFGIKLGIYEGGNYPNPVFGLFVLLVLAITVACVATLRNNRLGRRMLAIRSNERAAAATGIRVTQVKIIAFAISALLAGLAGALTGYRVLSLSSTSFSVFVTIAFLAVAYLGGISSVQGGLVGGLLAAGGLGFVFFENVVHLDKSWQPLIGGLALIVVVILQPDGAYEAMRAQAALVREKLTKGSGKDTRRGAMRPETERARAAAAHRVWAGLHPSEKAGTNSPLLEVDQLRVQYGGVLAVNDLSFVVRPGQVVGLIGPNGAGKTSVVDAISGFTPHSGTVRLAGDDLAGMQPHQRALAGLTRTFQTSDVFDDLLVGENVEVSRRGLLQRDGSTSSVEDILETFDLAEHTRRWPSELSNGQRRRLGVARAVRQSPDLLVLDEPAAGLDSRESTELGSHLRRIAATGLGVLLIDHDMDLVFQHCDYVYVMNFGSLLAEGDVESVKRDPLVLEAYLGSTLDAEPVDSGGGGQ